MKAKLGLVALGCLMWLLTSEATIRLFAWTTRERPRAGRQQSSDPRRKSRRSICERLKIVCLDPLELFRGRPEMEVYIENDPHFSPAGHELYGRFLAAELRRTAGATFWR